MSSPCPHADGECSTTCGSCGAYLNCQRPSSDFCSEMCQHRWIAQRNGEALGPEFQWRWAV